MASKLVVIYIVISWICYSGAENAWNLPSSKKYTGYLDKLVGTCDGYSHVAAEYHDVSIRYAKTGDILVDYNIIVTEDILQPLQTIWYVERCPSKEALDSCVKFGNFKTTHFCKLLETSGEAWSDFVNCVKPKWACPIRKGIYEGRNCTLKPGLFQFFPLYGSYWKIKSELRDGRTHKLKMCMSLEGGVHVQH